jgi:hypothetical protein
MPPRATKHQLFESSYYYLSKSSSYLPSVGRSLRGAALLTETSHSQLIPDKKSTGKQLLDAILKNDLKGVHFHLDHGATNPNVVLGLTTTTTTSSPTDGSSSSIHHHHHNNNNMIDKVFLWKKLFGEAATLVYIAIVNIYHCSCHQRAFEAALSIFKLLLVHGADVSTKVPNLFVREFPHLTESTPMDLALGIQRMALCSMPSGGKPEAAMEAAVALMKDHYHPSSSNTTTTNSKKMIPFNMVLVQGMDLMRELLFTEAMTTTAAEDNTATCLVFCLE